ncbi:hypothetical protein [Paraurantiacibacter namhicola]|uniref:Uncharacterized protein n=1 Tax=Paraurantiacibacter namhicola TaxID=645517 RepID=A0A1C7D5Q0_9SPHN|nr:hypothetical protein [Paraurantiacibacter namhicola]ANU06778.1 hypothetical protein A6F65_00453 [Paraurantiacibacter namhicola]
MLVLGLCFILGIVNFALHAAVLESGHPMLEQAGRFFTAMDGRASLLFEFAILLAAMLLAANGFPGWGWAYVIYSIFNCGTAWAILSGRM